MNVLLGKTPKMTREVSSKTVENRPLATENIQLKEAFHRVLRLPVVAEKTFLITIGDRSVTGMVARDQMVGPWQIPVSDVAVTTASLDSYHGEAMAMGERAPVALLDFGASARLAVAESITNIAGTNIGDIKRIKLSANWMSAAGHDGEDAGLYEAVKAVGEELCPALGITIPVGKDSMSMKTTWEENGEKKSVTAPLSLVISSFARGEDVGCTVLRKGKYMGTVDIKDTTKEELSRMMVGRDVQLQVDKKPAHPGDVVLDVEGVTIHNDQRKKDSVKDVTFQVHAGEIVCLAGIEGNGQTELVYGLTGLEKLSGGKITLDGKDITRESIRQRSKDGMSHIPEDRHKHGLVLDYSLENNMVLQRYWQPEFQKGGFIQSDKVREYSDKLIAQYDVRSGQGSSTIVRSMSGGNQQKAIIAREIDKDPKLLVAVQPTRGLDVGAIEYIHRQIVAQRDKGKAVLLVSLELDEVMNLSDRILVMYEGQIVGELDPKQTTVQELGLYMSGAKRSGKDGESA